MRKVLIIDHVKSYVEDVDMQLSFSFLDNADIITTSDLSGLKDLIRKEKPDEIVISASTYGSIPYAGELQNVVLFSKSEKDKDAEENLNLPSYGFMKYSEDLVTAIDQGEPKMPRQQASVHKSGKAGEDTTAELFDEMGNDPFDTAAEAGDREPKPSHPYLDRTEKTKEYSDVPMERESRRQPTRPVREERSREEIYEEPRREAPQHVSDIRENERSRSRSESQIKKKLAEKAAREQYEKDTGVVKRPAHVVTVYSAKGGVGKTTISCELATYLSLINAGRDRLRVCIADFNIDFGDVLVTLDLNEKGNTMKEWALDIKDMLEEGHKPENITFTAPQIESYLQRNEKSGLYALLAPISNIDSMDITDVEIEIMLDNLIKYGNFDFVVCDTGNNTRDSTYLAIQKADDILLVMTQDINTANCNIKALDTLNATELHNMDSIRLVMNKVQPDKLVGISVEEIERYVKNPQTDERFQTYAVIRDSNEVKNAENKAEPVVFNPSSEFTRAIGAVASRLIGENFVLESPKKKKKFGLFRRKGE